MAAHSPSNRKERQGTSTAIRRTVGGAVAGMVEAICLHPTDTIKTRLQMDRLGRYRGIFHCASTIVKEEGFRALYKGLTPFSLHLVSKYSLRFYSNSIFKSQLADSSGKTSNIGNFLAGMGSGTLEAIVIVTPFEVVKTRLQNQRGLNISQLKYRGPLHAAITIVRQEGLTALLKGVAPTIVRNSSNQAFNFMSYDLIRRTLWDPHGENNHLELWKTLITGFIAGAIGPIANCPADVIKTRLMSQETVKGVDPKYRGMFHAFHVIRREEGLRGLYRGLVPRLSRIAPGQAITWTVVEKVSQIFQEYDDRAF